MGNTTLTAHFEMITKLILILRKIYVMSCLCSHLVCKTDPFRFKRGFGEGLLKDEFAKSFFEACKIRHLRGENCLQNAHFYKQKGPCLKCPFNWTGSVLPLLKSPEMSLCNVIRDLKIKWRCECLHLRTIYVMLCTAYAINST